MNKLYRIVIYALALHMCVSCDDILETAPEGGIITEDQLNDVLDQRPELSEGGVRGILSGMIAPFTIDGHYSFGTYHYDFGYPALSMQLDAAGQDWVSPADLGYDWFKDSHMFKDRAEHSDVCYFVWRNLYGIVKSANDVLKGIPADEEKADRKVSRGQALTFRAFAYFNLAQLYQFTYVGSENKLCVPIVRSAMTQDDVNSNPRATVKEVYDFILKDLEEAGQLLEGYGRPSKDFADARIVNGLKARVALVMNDWVKAAECAKKAHDGMSPYTIADLQEPRFYDINDRSWMWGLIITEISDCVGTGIVNWQSHLCSTTGNGYTSVGTFRNISKSLFDTIPDTDVRRMWWLDSKQCSDIFKQWLEVDTDTIGRKLGIPPYANMKFGPNDGGLYNATNAGDWPLMRVEEMILIEAEALAMNGQVDAGKNVLEKFMQEYRDPDYKCEATLPEDIQNEVWLQRRIELWGEGLSFFDIMRLKKPLKRVYEGSNFVQQGYFDVKSEDPILIYMIPETEMQTNKGIQENNPFISYPVTVPKE